MAVELTGGRRAEELAVVLVAHRDHCGPSLVAGESHCGCGGMGLSGFA